MIGGIDGRGADLYYHVRSTFDASLTPGLGPMSAQIIDGLVIAAKRLRQAVAAHAEDMRVRQGGIVPGLAVILVGDDPASQVYVRNKTAFAKKSASAPIAIHCPLRPAKGNSSISSAI